MGVFDFTVIPIHGDPHPPSSPSSKSCHNMMEKGLKSSRILVKETNKKKERISKSKATSSAAASMKFCVCAPPTHPDSFKCRLHRATASAHPRTVSSSTSKKICLCAPATHPGSFKCRLHRATTSSHTGKYFCYDKMVCDKKKKRFNFSCCLTNHVFSFPSFFAVSSSAHHINGVKGTKNLNALKLVTSSQSGGVRNSSKGNVHGKPKLSRFGRAALVHAAAAATSSVLIQPISAEFGQMSLS